MSVRTVSITIEIRCDRYYLCGAAPRMIQAATLADAHAKARAAGWWIGRRYGAGRVECPQCHREHCDGVKAGVLTKEGYIVDEDRWHAWLDARALVS